MLLYSGTESVSSSFVTRALLKFFFSISCPLLSLFRHQTKAEEQNQRPLWGSSSEHTRHLSCACEHRPEMETSPPHLRNVYPCNLAKMGTWRRETRLGRPLCPPQVTILLLLNLIFEKPGWETLAFLLAGLEGPRKPFAIGESQSEGPPNWRFSAETICTCDRLSLPERTRERRGLWDRDLEGARDGFQINHSSIYSATPQTSVC